MDVKHEKNIGNNQDFLFVYICVMFTGSLQGRIDLQGVPCKPYRGWVCSVVQLVLELETNLIDENVYKLEFELSRM